MDDEVIRFQTSGDSYLLTKNYIEAGKNYSQVISRCNKILKVSTRNSYKALAILHIIPCYNNLTLCCLQLNNYYETINNAALCLEVMDTHITRQVSQSLKTRDITETIIKQWKQTAYFYQGKAYYSLNEYRSALNSLESSLELCDSTNTSMKEEIISLIDNSRTKIKRRIDNEQPPKQKSSGISSVRAETSKLDDESSGSRFQIMMIEVVSLRNLADYNFECKNFDVAMESYSKAVELLNRAYHIIVTYNETADFLEHIIPCYYSLSVCDFQHSKYWEAIAHAKECLKMIELAIGNGGSRRGTTGLVLASLRFRDLSEDVLSKKWKRKAFTSMGQCYFQLNQFDLALEHFNSALSLIQGDIRYSNEDCELQNSIIATTTILESRSQPTSQGRGAKSHLTTSVRLATEEAQNNKSEKVPEVMIQPEQLLDGQKNSSPPSLGNASVDSNSKDINSKIEAGGLYGNIQSLLTENQGLRMKLFSNPEKKTKSIAQPSKQSGDTKPQTDKPTLFSAANSVEFTKAPQTEPKVTSGSTKDLTPTSEEPSESTTVASESTPSQGESDAKQSNVAHTQTLANSVETLTINNEPRKKKLNKKKNGNSPSANPIPVSPPSNENLFVEQNLNPVASSDLDRDDGAESSVAHNYATKIYDRGIYSLNILCASRRAQLQQYTTFIQETFATFSAPFMRILLRIPKETSNIENLSGVNTLDSWLSKALGVSSGPLLDRLVRAVKDRGYLTIEILRQDSPWLIENLVSEHLNIYVAQTIIDYLNSESPVTSSPYLCQNSPIIIEENSVGKGRILRGKVKLWYEDTKVIVKVHRSAAECSREVKLLTEMNKKNQCYAPLILSSDEKSEGPYLVMRSFGVSLNQIFYKDLSSEFRLIVATDLLHAMIWLHQLQIVHCDIKPENLLVEEPGGGIARMKICDLDSATKIGDPFPSGTSTRGTSLLKFTKQWVSPEVYFHNISLQENSSTIPLLANTSMDVFPLGLVLGCLFNLEKSPLKMILPFEDESLMIVLREQSSLLRRITCDSFPTMKQSIHSLCELIVENRGNLRDVLEVVTSLRRTNLQEITTTQAKNDHIIERVNEVNVRVQTIGKKIDRAPQLVSEAVREIKRSK